MYGIRGRGGRVFPFLLFAGPDCTVRVLMYMYTCPMKRSRANEKKSQEVGVSVTANQVVEGLSAMLSGRASSVVQTTLLATDVACGQKTVA